MARLLIVHHTTSPSTQAMLEAVLEGARTDEIDGVEVVTRAALAATAVDVLAADAVILGTPANIGYMSGALKHFFVPLRDRGPALHALRARQQRHHRRGPLRGDHRQRHVLAPAPAARHRGRRTVPRGPGSVLGVGRGHCTGRG